MPTPSSPWCSDRPQSHPGLANRKAVELMGFRFANVEGRAVLVHGNQYYDLSAASGGLRPSAPRDAPRRTPQPSAPAPPPPRPETNRLFPRFLVRTPAPPPPKTLA